VQRDIDDDPDADIGLCPMGVRVHAGTVRRNVRTSVPITFDPRVTAKALRPGTAGLVA